MQGSVARYRLFWRWSCKENYTTVYRPWFKFFNGALCHTWCWVLCTYQLYDAPLHPRTCCVIARCASYKTCTLTHPPSHPLTDIHWLLTHNTVTIQTHKLLTWRTCASEKWLTNYKHWHTKWRTSPVLKHLNKNKFNDKSFCPRFVHTLTWPTYVFIHRATISK